MMTELKRAGGNELRDFKELSLEELRRGYVIHRDGTYTCIFCGASFETGVIYHSRGRDVTQKTLLSCIYEGKSTDEIGEIMGISTATVRAHKFNLQKAKREAKILLTLLEILEGEEPPVPRPVHGESGAESSGIEQTDDLFSLNMLHPFFTQFRYK